VRIIAGSARGTTLLAPEGLRTRPTGSRAREALFSVLTSRGVFGDAPVVLDLYAGTGALGLEAVSRGAAEATLVESTPAVAALARENARRARLAAQVQIVNLPVEKFLRAPPPALAGRVALAFLDPPYEANLLPQGLRALAESRLLAAGATVVAERRHGTDPAPAPAGLQAADERRWGEAAVTIYVAEAEAGA